MRDTRLGELAPAIVALDDAVAHRLVQRLVDEIVLFVDRAQRELGFTDYDLVLGGGMLADRGRLYELVAERLPVEPVVLTLPPVAGSVLAALEPKAQQRFREAFEGWRPG
jgi:hypothetical protein